MIMSDDSKVKSERFWLSPALAPNRTNVSYFMSAAEDRKYTQTDMKNERCNFNVLKYKLQTYDIIILTLTINDWKCSVQAGLL